MTFQFLCPQGHLLQGDEAHMGMQCQCPQCGMAFIIPTIERSAPTGSEATVVSSQAAQVGPQGLEQPVAIPEDEDSEAGFGGGAPLEFGAVDVSDLDGAAEEDSILHIPCPNGHELETPPDMIGQRVMCPHCRVEFRLKREKSIEYRRQQELLDRKRGEFWFRLSIVAAALVGLVLLIMFTVMMLS